VKNPMGLYVPLCKLTPCPERWIFPLLSVFGKWWYLTHRGYSGGFQDQVFQNLADSGSPSLVRLLICVCE